MDDRSGASLSEAEERVARAIAISGRQCGECSLCCKLLRVPALEKVEDEWCKHCSRPGCSIYSARPQMCRDYACVWLSDKKFGDEWYPAKAGMVMDLGRYDESGYAVLRVHVDPDHRGRWREEPYISQLRKLARIGLNRERAGGQFQTVVTECGKKILILPDGELEVTPPGVLVRDARNAFRFIRCKDAEEMRRVSARAVALAAVERSIHERPDAAPIEIIEHAAVVLKQGAVQEHG